MRATPPWLWFPLPVMTESWGRHRPCSYSTRKEAREEQKTHKRRKQLTRAAWTQFERGRNTDFCKRVVSSPTQYPQSSETEPTHYLQLSLNQCKTQPVDVRQTARPLLITKQATRSVSLTLMFCLGSERSPLKHNCFASYKHDFELCIIQCFIRVIGADRQLNPSQILNKWVHTHTQKKHFTSCRRRQRGLHLAVYMYLFMHSP